MADIEQREADNKRLEPGAASFATALLHLTPKGQQCTATASALPNAKPFGTDGTKWSQTVRCYGIYSNRTRCQDRPKNSWQSGPANYARDR
jgi:hypothetical protein